MIGGLAGPGSRESIFHPFACLGREQGTGGYIETQHSLYPRVDILMTDGGREMK